MSLPAGYRLKSGSVLDRARLLKFMQRTYAEQFAAGQAKSDRSFAHLAQTVEQYLSRETPLWWVEVAAEPAIDAAISPPTPFSQRLKPIACLWLGTAIDQLQGDRHTHIFLLYVDPAHRRRGIATALMRQAEDFAAARGDRQIGLQVFQANQAALNLYQQLGFEPQSLWLVKPLG